jgi:hypothetical protein
MSHGQATGEADTRFGGKAVQRLQHQWYKTSGAAQRRLRLFSAATHRMVLKTCSHESMQKIAVLLKLVANHDTTLHKFVHTLESADECDMVGRQAQPSSSSDQSR